MNIRIQKLFLLDGIGAALTAFSLGIVLNHFQAYFGMPQNILYFLSSIALIYAAYSFICYFFVDRKMKFFLAIIAIANAVYGCLTIWYVSTNYDNLTKLGLTYFILELMVLTIVIGIEIKVLIRNASYYPKSEF